MAVCGIFWLPTKTFKNVKYRTWGMNREQAISVIKELFERCQFIEGKSIKLLPPKGDNTLSNTYQIYVQINSDNLLASYMEVIAKERNLAFMCKEGYCIIYKPYLNMCDPI